MKNYSKMNRKKLIEICTSIGISIDKWIKIDKIVEIIKNYEKEKLLNISKYIQISERNFKYFFTKWYIFPLNLVENNDNLWNDLFKNYLNYIPLVTKNISWVNDDIFLEVNNINDFEYLDLENWILLYNSILPLSKIKNIYISNKEIYDSVLNSNYSSLYIPKNIIIHKKIDLEIIPNISFKDNIENDKILELWKELFDNNILLWWKQLLKLVNNDIYNDFIFFNETKELEFIYNYYDSNIKDDNYNDYILISFIKENIRKKISLEWKDSLNNFYDFFTNTIKKFIENWMLDKDSNEIQILREKSKNIKNTIDKKITIKQLLDTLNEEKDYWIIIYLLLNKYWKIEELASFIELWINTFNDIRLKILLSFIYWEIVWYSSLYVEKNIEWKNIKFKLDITDEFDIDIYENKVDKDKIKYISKIVKQKDIFIFIKNLIYWNSWKIIWQEFIENIDKKNIEWYFDLENDVNNLKNEILELNNEISIKDKEILKINEYKFLLNEIKKQDLEFFKNRKYEILEKFSIKNNLINNETNFWTDWNYKLPI